MADRLAQNRNVEGLALVSAFWARYCHGETDSGRPIAPNDPNWTRLTAQARRAVADPRAWLEMEDVFGDLGVDTRYVEAFCQALERIWSIGTKATLEEYLGVRR